MCFEFSEDNIHLSDVPHFDQFCLIGKVLGQFMPLNLIFFKCIVDWKFTGEVNFVDRRKSFSLVKFITVLDCTRGTKCQSWFAGGQIHSFRRWKSNFDPVKEKLQFVLLWIRLSRLLIEM